MDNKVNFLRGTATEYEASTKDNDTFYYTTDDEKLYLGNKEITGGGVTIDNALSDTSEHPVQNKVITNALNTKANLTDIPTTLPANGGNADTIDGKHADEFIYARGYFDSIDLNEIRYPCSGLATGCSNAPTDKMWGTLIVFAGGTGSFTQIYVVATLEGVPSDVWIRQYPLANNQLEWTPWRNTADGGNAALVGNHPSSDFALKTDIPTSLPANGGNADTLDGKHAESFMQWLGILGDTNILNNANYKVDYHCNISDGTIVGLPIAGWYHIVYYMHEYQNGHGMQIAYPLNFEGATMIRRATGTTWEAWKNIADGGNASTANFATYSDYAGGSVQSTASNACLRNISAGTADLSAGVSELATGTIYLVYE